MNTPNFRCPLTKEEFFIPRTRIKFEGTKAVHLDARTGKPPVNPANGAVLEPIPVEGSYSTVLGSSKSEGKKKLVKHLRERSHNHYKREIADQKKAILDKTTLNA